MFGIAVELFDNREYKDKKILLYQKNIDLLIKINQILENMKKLLLNI